MLKITEVWLASFKLYKLTLKKVWYLSFAMTALIMLSAYLLGPAFTPNQTTLNSPSFNLIFFVNIVITILVSAFFLPLILHRIYHVAADPQYSLHNSVTLVLSKYLIILSAVTITVICALIGFILFIIPGVVISVLLLFSVPLIIFDNFGWYSALKQSYHLVLKNWWQTFIILLVPNILIWAVEIVLNLVTSFTYAWISILIVILYTSIVKPYTNAVLLIQFNNLKSR